MVTADLETAKLMFSFSLNYLSVWSKLHLHKTCTL